jgi:hypothetical protein
MFRNIFRNRRQEMIQEMEREARRPKTIEMADRDNKMCSADTLPYVKNTETFFKALRQPGEVLRQVFEEENKKNKDFCKVPDLF